MVDARFVKLPDERKIAYQEYGDPHGYPVFFFHGWIGSRLDFAPNDAIAAEAGARVISIDRPGCGPSDFKTDRRLLDWPTDVASVADALDIDRFAVCGHSFGGPYALACAHELPERGPSVKPQRSRLREIGRDAIGELLLRRTTQHDDPAWK